MLMNPSQLSLFNKIIIVALLLAVITFLDYFTGNEISFSIFYLIPIIFAGWLISINAGILFSLVSAILWFLSDFLNDHPYSHYLIPYWNTIVRLAFFLCVTYLLGLIKNEREREKEITQFVAHDLRSPLANILTSLKLLNEDEEPPTQNQKELIDLSISTGNRMLIFINSLLDLGRLEAKKLPLNITNVEVPQIIKAAVAQVTLLAREKSIDINVDQNIDNINADGNLLLRIIVNLLSNAIKVSDKGTQIKVTAKKLNESNCIFSIKDQGPGIDKRLQKKLFRKYLQGSKMIVGSGIGLSFCKLAVEAHKGYIKLESIEGKGTEVYFVLPK